MIIKKFGKKRCSARLLWRATDHDNNQIVMLDLGSRRQVFVTSDRCNRRTLRPARFFLTCIPVKFVIVSQFGEVNYRMTINGVEFYRSGKLFGKLYNEQLYL